MLVFMQSILERSCIFYLNRLYKIWNILQIFDKTTRSVKRICICEVAVNWQCKISAASSCWITNVSDHFPFFSIFFAATSRVSIHSFPNNFYPALSWPFFNLHNKSNASLAECYQESWLQKIWNKTISTLSVSWFIKSWGQKNCSLELVS